jgi:hypothetical protein
MNMNMFVFKNVKNKLFINFIMYIKLINITKLFDNMDIYYCNKYLYIKMYK